MYKNFAVVYDLFMSNAPYDMWVRNMETIWAKYEQCPKLILELACGTGSITSRFAAKGYDMIGLDISEDMLSIAAEKNNTILYLNQDMREFELYGTVDSIICLCDGLNYLLQEDDLLAVFKLANNYLNPGGLFIFDMNTQYKYAEIMADNDFTEVTDQAAYFWRNYFDDESDINEYELTVFVKNSRGSYNRFDEVHYQRAYLLEPIERLLKKAGFSILDICDADNLKKPTHTTERIYFITQGAR